MSLLSLLGLDPQKQSREVTLLGEIEELLPDLSESELKLVTGIAGLCGKVAFADFDFTEEEGKRIEELLGKELNLSQNQASSLGILLRRLTKDLGGVQDVRYSRLIRESLDKPARIELLKVLFEVGSADGTISEEEERAIGEIATGLALARSDYIEARRAFTEKLEVMQNLSKR